MSFDLMQKQVASELQGDPPQYHPEVMDLRMLIQELREAEFKSGVLDHDVVLSQRKRALSEALAQQVRAKLDALEQVLLRAAAIGAPPRP